MSRIQLQSTKIHVAADTNASTALTAITGWSTTYGWDFNYTFQAERQTTNPIVPSGLPRYTRIGGELATVTFSVPLEIDAADGAANTDLSGSIAVPSDLFWKAAGWGATATDTTVTYALSDIDAAHQRIAVVFSDGNRNLVLRRALATLSLAIDPRQQLILTVECHGVLETFDTTATMPTFPAIGENTTPPALVRGMTLSVNDGSSTDTADEVYGLELNFTNGILMPEDLTAESGYAEGVIENRELGGMFKLPVPLSGDSIGRKNQRSQSEATVTVTAESPWSVSSKEIDVTFTMRPCAITEVTPDQEAIVAESTSFMVQEDLSSASVRPQVVFRDLRRTG